MPASVDLRLGIDVGGTNTDAVVLDADDRLLAKIKTPTTPDVTIGHRQRLGRGARRRSTSRSQRITHVMLGHDARDQRRSSSGATC